jgi:hypothetical protein
MPGTATLLNEHKYVRICARPMLGKLSFCYPVLTALVVAAGKMCAILELCSLRAYGNGRTRISSSRIGIP